MVALHSSKRILPALFLVLASAPPAIIASLAPSGEVTIAPAFACTGYTSIPAIPTNNVDDGKAPLVATNTRVLLYDAQTMLTKALAPEDDLVLVEGGAVSEPEKPQTFPGLQLPFQRRELFPGLTELVPTAPLKPQTEYSLVWKSGQGQRAQSHFTVGSKRDEKPPKIGMIGPATITPPSEARTSCDHGGRKLTIPFGYEDESPVVVGVWGGAKAEGDPLAWTAVWKNELRINLLDTEHPILVTLMAFDSAGHQSAPCSLSIAPESPPKTSRFGCGKSGTPKSEVKNCQKG